MRLAGRSGPMRLGVKSRIAIVASVLWLVGGSFYFSSQLTGKGDRESSFAVKVCVDGGENPDDPEKCVREGIEAYNLYAGDFPLRDGFLTALAIWIAGVLIGLACYGTVRWILAGR